MSQSDGEALRECGHCGHTDIRQVPCDSIDGLPRGIAIMCEGCAMATPFCETFEKAQAIWNRRSRPRADAPDKASLLARADAHMVKFPTHDLVAKMAAALRADAPDGAGMPMFPCSECGNGPILTHRVGCSHKPTYVQEAPSPGSDPAAVAALTGIRDHCAQVPIGVPSKHLATTIENTATRALAALRQPAAPNPRRPSDEESPPTKGTP